MNSSGSRLIAGIVCLALITGGYLLIKNNVKPEDTVSSSDRNFVTTPDGKTVMMPRDDGDGNNGSSNFLEPAAFASQVKQLKKKEKSSAELTQVTAADGAFVVQFRKASDDSAYGYQSNSAMNLEPVKVTISGAGSLKEKAFPLSQLNSGVAATITRQLRKKAGSKAKLQSLVLQRNPVSGKLMWVVSYENATRTGLAYFAPASGKPLSTTPPS